MAFLTYYPTNLPPEKEVAFKAQAQARGLSLEQWMLEVVDQQVQPVSIAHLQKTNPATTPISPFSPTKP